MKIEEKAHAKINLSIDIVSKMDSGYHNMRMIMQSVGLYDAVQLTCTPGDGFVISTDLRYLPTDERNIAVRASAVFYKYTGISGYKTQIRITKNIPVCAGLGGGSTDGAAVLRGLNTMFKTKLSRKTLERLADQIGSDVPFCVAGGTTLAEGKGDILSDLTALTTCHVVICKPPFAISTPELFSKINCPKISLRPDTDGIICELDKNNLHGVARRMYNVFEDVLSKGTGAVGEIKETLLDNGAHGAVMTGTGSAVFGLFDDEERARCAYSDLSRTYKECFLTKTIDRLAIT